MNVSHELVNGVSGARVQLLAHDFPGIGDADQDHASVCIRERNDCLLQLFAAEPCLELHMLALFRKLALEFLKVEGKRKILPGGVKWGI